MATPFIGGKFQALNASGIVPGALLYTYAAGTTTPLATFTSQSGLSSNMNPVLCDANGQADVWLGASAYHMILKTSLGIVIWDEDNLIAPVDLTTSTGASLVGFLQSGTSAATRTVQSKLRDVVSVKDFGAVGDGVADDAGAFNAAWQAIKATGGLLYVPPANYLLNSQWLLDVDLTLPHNYVVMGYGATLFAGASVTGHAIRVYKGYNNFGVKIEGFQFNHRGNTTVAGCIQGQGSSNLHIIKCSVEHHNTKAGYAGIELGLYTAGIDNTSTFWATIDGFRTRIRSGADGTIAAIGVRLVGAANATRIVGCTFSSVVDSIRLDFEPTTGSHCNGLVIDDNSFEGVTNAVTINTATGSAGMPTGVRILNNRSETLTTFLNIAGVAVSNTSYPPILQNNYATVGSVTNYLVNPNNQFVFSLEPSFFGVGARNYIGGPTNFQIIADGVGKNLTVSDLSGNSNYSGAHLVMSNHFWVDAASGKLFSKATAPASGQDGQMVGSISGTATFAAGTSVVVTVGATMAAATYKVAISASANKTFWVSSKTTTQFTLNASASSSDTVDWLLTV